MATNKKTTARAASRGLSAEEKAAMRETLRERARDAKATSREEGEKDLLAKIAEMAPSDRAMARRIHSIVMAAAPDLWPKTWYGMPAYAKDGKVICFFQSGQKFKSRYATLGFQPAANLDDGDMWSTSFALNKLNPADEERIAALIKKAVS